MQAAVAHTGDRETKPQGRQAVNAAFAQGSGRVCFMAPGVETWLRDLRGTPMPEINIAVRGAGSAGARAHEDKPVPGPGRQPSTAFQYPPGWEGALMCSGDGPRDGARSAHQPPSIQERAHTSPSSSIR